MAQLMRKLETTITSVHIAYSIYFKSISNILAVIPEDMKETSKSFLRIDIAIVQILNNFPLAL